MKKVDIPQIYKILGKEIQKYQLPLSDSVELKTNDPFKVLVATILSARTKDTLTEKICDNLFKEVKNVADLDKINLKKLEKLIYPVSFYKNKARNLKKLPSVLKEVFDNKIPSDVDELTKLPGVGRKTANIVSAVAFKKNAIGVDTHVHKIVNRWGYVKTKKPEDTEKELRKKLPIKYWKNLNTYLVTFGQHVCRPTSPWCSKCPIKQYCNQINVDKKR